MTEKPTLESIIGVAPKKNEVVATPNDNLPTKKEGEQQFDTDFERSRINLIHVIGETNKALTTMMAIANEREDAKSFETVGTLLKTLAATSKDLLEIHNAKKSFYEPYKGSPNDPTINNQGGVVNAVFTGTPTEMREWLKQKSAAEKSAADVIDVESEEITSPDPQGSNQDQS